jgi:hypothetical protein
MRFVTGHEEALQHYREAEQARLPEWMGVPEDAVWNEDLFHPRQPTRQPLGNQQGGPEARLFDPRQQTLPVDLAFSAWADGNGDHPRLPSSTPAVGDGDDFATLAFLLAGVLLAQVQVGYDDRMRLRPDWPGY